MHQGNGAEIHTKKIKICTEKTKDAISQLELLEII